MTLKRHELSALWGDAPDEEYAQMVTDMEVNGFLKIQPIVLLDGEVLDGWHRYTAAHDAKVSLEYQGDKIPEGALTTPDERILNPEYFVDFAKAYPGVDPVDFVIAANARRRSLTAKQRARAVLAARKWGDPDYDNATNEQMAREAGVSESTLHREKREQRKEAGEETPAHGTSTRQKDLEDDIPDEGKGSGGNPPPAPPEEPSMEDLARLAETHRQDALFWKAKYESSGSAELMAALEKQVKAEQTKVLELQKKVDQLTAANRVLRAKLDGVDNASDIKAATIDKLEKLKLPRSGEAGVKYMESVEEGIAFYADKSGVDAYKTFEWLREFDGVQSNLMNMPSRRKKDAYWTEMKVKVGEFVTSAIEHLSS